MKALLKNIPVLLFAALEIIIGVMLFKDPSGVTEIVLLIIGVALALSGAYKLIRALVARNNGEEGAFAALVIGLLLLAWLVSSFLVNPFLFPFLLVNIYVVWGLIAYFALKMGFVKHTHPLVPGSPQDTEQDQDTGEDGDRKP